MSDSLFQLEGWFSGKRKPNPSRYLFYSKQREVIVFLVLLEVEKYPLKLIGTLLSPTSENLLSGTDLQKSILWSIEKKSLISFKSIYIREK